MTKILVVKVSSMGDIIHAFPALNDAKNSIPNLECDWVVEESFYDIAKLNLDIDNVLKVSLRRWRHEIIKNYKNGEYQQFLHGLRSKKYDYIIDCQGLLKSALIACAAHGPRYGLDFKSVREPAASLLYTNKINIPKNTYVITKTRTLFSKSLGYDLIQTPPKYNLFDGAINLDFNLPSKYVVFLHGTSRADKCWSEEKWVELTSIYTKNDIPVLLPFGDETEKARAMRVAKTSSLAIALPKLSLAKMAYIIRNSMGVVGLDTGLSHLAAAYNIPMLSLYGPTDIAQISPKGETQICRDLYTIPPQDVYSQLDTLIKSFN